MGEGDGFGLRPDPARGGKQGGHGLQAAAIGRAAALGLLHEQRQQQAAGANLREGGLFVGVALARGNRAQEGLLVIEVEGQVRPPGEGVLDEEAAFKPGPGESLLLPGDGTLADIEPGDLKAEPREGFRFRCASASGNEDALAGPEQAGFRPVAEGGVKPGALPRRVVLPEAGLPVERGAVCVVDRCDLTAMITGHGLRIRG